MNRELEAGRTWVDISASLTSLLLQNAVADPVAGTRIKFRQTKSVDLAMPFGNGVMGRSAARQATLQNGEW